MSYSRSHWALSITTQVEVKKSFLEYRANSSYQIFDNNFKGYVFPAYKYTTNSLNSTLIVTVLPNLMITFVILRSFRAEIKLKYLKLFTIKDALCALRPRLKTNCFSDYSCGPFEVFHEFV